ncbi:hypothetical protein M527_06420 [Sphingobium indicum IP26]|uniref:Pectate lyase superfamily protein domain-containing protein n=1 Tax=Sphingobium indicum F2 TaxID=1450518 RepID=A0A8E0WTS5_9SPHN|nr:hypothetical protein [Sphingobium indicum]EPR09758.1 hypothetical protein M527_06420 [Sphingobium indicum IP26]KER37292.1 hypothetical protein AL00_06375 [Sphingobium indicum F2]
MTNYAVENPYPVILGTNGSGLNAGSVYIGIAGQDPETNPVPVYWDAAGTILATQPLTTIGGYIWNAGTPAQIYGPSEYSIRVRDRFGAQVFYDANVGGPLADFVASLATSAGAGLVGFSHSASYPASTVGKTLQQRFIAITDAPFSAPTDGTSSCVAAFNAIAALSAGDLHIFIPPGDWVIDGEVLFTDKNVTLVGCGPASRLRFTTTTGKIRFYDTSTGSVAKKLNVLNVTLLKDYAATSLDGSVGIEAQWSYTGVIASWEHALFENVTAQANGNTKYWDTAIRLIDAGVVRAINCRLDNAGAQASGSRAFIELERRAASNTCSFHFVSCFAYGTTAGVRLTHSAAPAGTIEGVYLTDCEFPGTRYAIYDDNEGTADTTRQVNDVKWIGGHASVSRALLLFGYASNIFVDSGNFTFNNLADSAAALEAGIIFRTYAESVNVESSRFFRGSGAATGKPTFLLPTRDNVRSVRIIGNSIGAFGYVVNQVGTATRDKNRILVADNQHEGVPSSSTSSGFFVNNPQIVAQSAVAASVTGTTTETTLATVSILGGTVGANGRLRITTLWSYTNNANSKSFRLRLGGTQIWSRAEGSSDSARHSAEMANRNSQSSQVTSSGSGGGGWGPVTATVTTTAIDTSATQSLTITAQLANSGDTATLEAYIVELLYGE